jgi:hypothetical protein
MSDKVKLKTSGVQVKDGADINLEYMSKTDSVMLHLSDFDSETLLAKGELFDLIVKLTEIYGDLK